jgi:hypothetical protein
MGVLATVIGLFLALLPIVIGAVARSKGRSAFTWGLLSLILTPFGSLTLLLILPEQDRNVASEAGSGIAKLGTLSGAFAKIALGDGAEAARHAELDQKFAAEARGARVDQLIAEQLDALKAAQTPNSAPTGMTGSSRPSFGKRR